MPVSKRTSEGSKNDDGLKGSSLAGSQKGKRKSKPTGKKRSRKQSTKDRYAHAREDAQLEGLIPTTPEEALKPEAVDPASQDDGAPALLAKLTAQAIRQGWAVPDVRKPGLIDELTAIIDNPETPARVKVAAFSALRMADKDQYERDHPEAAGKARGGNGVVSVGGVAVNVSIQTNVAAVKLLNEMLDDPGRSIEDITTPHIAGAPGDGGHGGQVAPSAALESDQPGVGAGVADTQQSDGNQRPIPAR